MHVAFSDRQEEIEAAMLKASRDQVENLMQVVDKMQHQQTKLLVTLQAEKKSISAVSCTSLDKLGCSRVVVLLPPKKIPNF